MNRIKSIFLGSLLATASVTALSQNANAAELKSEHDHLNRNTVAFNNSRDEHERQIREQRARELRERQLRELRERRDRELRERHARELRERYSHFYH